MTSFHHEIKTLDIKREIQSIRRAAKKTAATKESARRFLISTGMYTKSGQLKRAYR